MIKNLIIIALILVIVYLYYQKKHQTNFLTGTASKEVDQSFQNFLTTNLNSNSLQELKTKLGEKTLDELIEENEDYETEVDTLTRAKNSLEQDLTAQSNSFQSRLKEKERENKKLKEDLTSEKQVSKGSIERINKLTEQITKLEKMPGQFPPSQEAELTKTHQEQLRKINLLFDENAQDYAEIDFNGLYKLLENIAKKKKKQVINKIVFYIQAQNNFKRMSGGKLTVDDSNLEDKPPFILMNNYNNLNKNQVGDFSNFREVFDWIKNKWENGFLHNDKFFILTGEFKEVEENTEIINVSDKKIGTIKDIGS